MRKSPCFNILPRSSFTNQNRASAEAKWSEIGNHDGFIFVTASLVEAYARAHNLPFPDMPFC